MIIRLPWINPIDTLNLPEEISRQAAIDALENTKEVAR